MQPIFAARPQTTYKVTTPPNPRYQSHNSISKLGHDTVHFGSQSKKATSQNTPDPKPSKLTTMGKLGMYGGGLITLAGTALTVVALAHIPVFGLGFLALPITLPILGVGALMMYVAHKNGREDSPSSKKAVLNTYPIDDLNDPNNPNNYSNPESPYYSPFGDPNDPLNPMNGCNPASPYFRDLNDPNNPDNYYDKNSPHYMDPTSHQNPMNQ